MALMKELAEKYHVLDTQNDILQLNKMAARRVANELNYSKKCKDEIEKAKTPEEVDKAMYDERKRKNA